MGKYTAEARVIQVRSPTYNDAYVLMLVVHKGALDGRQTVRYDVRAMN